MIKASCFKRMMEKETDDDDDDCGDNDDVSLRR